jgi:polysaccharide biosynthesis/export protein
VPDRRVALLTLALAGCAVFAGPGASLPALPPASSTAYLLGPGDQIRLRVFDQDSLSGLYVVGDDGTVNIPLAGRITAAGLSLASFADAVATRLRDRAIMNAPAVAAEIATYRVFYVLGEVTHPGAYPYRPGMSVLSAVSLAGGFTDRALQAYVGITRRNGRQSVEYRAQPEALPEPGDVITVFERRF